MNQKIQFQIQDKVFEQTIDLDKQSFIVDSVPRSYTVHFESATSFHWIESYIRGFKHPLILIDKNIRSRYLTDVKFDNLPVYEVNAVEDNKNIDMVLTICNWLLEQKANRGSHLFVIGGGILQDLGAFAGYMYKRGIPWTLIPTTLLAQADSGLGGKTAVNHGNSKNVLGLFSAPRQVIVDTNFLLTLNRKDYLSGAGEIFRLLLTSGLFGLELLEKHLEGFLRKDADAIQTLISASLQIKRIIVEEDEFELDLRRSMNYGHSIGHALEALSNYYVPHGQAVTLGILVENQISVNRNLLSKDMAARIKAVGLQLLSEDIVQLVNNISVDGLLPYLSNDKKAEGSTLKLATLIEIGQMKFVDLPLDSRGLEEVVQAFKEILK